MSSVSLQALEMCSDGSSGLGGTFQQAALKSTLIWLCVLLAIYIYFFLKSFWKSSHAHSVGSAGPFTDREPEPWGFVFPGPCWPISVREGSQCVGALGYARVNTRAWVVVHWQVWKSLKNVTQEGKRVSSCRNWGRVGACGAQPAAGSSVGAEQPLWKRHSGSLVLSQGSACADGRKPFGVVSIQPAGQGGGSPCGPILSETFFVERGKRTLLSYLWNLWKNHHGMLTVNLEHFTSFEFLPCLWGITGPHSQRQPSHVSLEVGVTVEVRTSQVNGPSAPSEPTRQEANGTGHVTVLNMQKAIRFLFSPPVFLLCGWIKRSVHIIWKSQQGILQIQYFL